ncbi:MAG: M14 family zinc carboxypeptidase [Kiritimatiellia bacterium]|nr:M14 family zinc carboxypeptidase [Kiritimatiellia bacterium]
MRGLFIDTYFENASPLETEEVDGALEFLPLADSERFSGNRQTTHWNFKIRVAPENVGRTLRLRLRQKTTIWNGQSVPAYGNDSLSSVFSIDGVRWSGISMLRSERPGIAAEMEIRLSHETVQVAHLVPYTESHLQQMQNRLAGISFVRINPIGSTVEGRPLEMIEIGDPNLPAVFFRARAHPWESGGSWFLEGLADFLTTSRPEAERALRTLSFCLLPMAARDGVARGMTRFTVNGFDLNRGWGSGREFDPALCPENACLKAWFERRKSENRLPFLAIDLHNDQQGHLHPSHPEPDNGYTARIDKLEGALRRNTWFTEGRTTGSFRNPGTIGEGLIEIFGVDALIWELRDAWAEGLGKIPLSEDWMQLGEQSVSALLDYRASISGMS